MRILLCHNFYQEPGGEDQVFADEGWLLESHGHEVIRYTRHNDDIDRMGRWESARKTIWNRQTRTELQTLIRERRPDVMHCHNTFPLISPSAYAAAKSEGVPVVQTLHNYRLLCPSALFLRDGHACEDCLGKLVAWPGVLHGCYRNNRPATAAIATMLAVHRVRGTWSQGVQRFIALSEFSRRKFVQGGLPAARIATKANFMRTDPQPGEGRGGFALFVGRLAIEKGIDTLLAAWRNLPQALPLKIVGDGPLAEQVRSAAAADPRISYLGRQSSSEVLSLLGDAACLVLPSVCYENCPKTLIEAYASATPVIASRLGAIEEMIDHGRTGLLFESGNPADLVVQVQRLHAADETRRAMRRAAREAYELRYTCESNYAALMEIYRDAFNNRECSTNEIPSQQECHA